MDKPNDFIEPPLVYVVDDDEDDFIFLSNAIKENWPHIHILHFEDPGIFLNRIKTIQAPGLIILDINMPKISGFEVIEQLKESEKFKSIPVAFLSTSSDDISQTKAKKLGAISYLIKPPALPDWRKIAAEINNLTRN